MGIARINQRITQRNQETLTIYQPILVQNEVDVFDKPGIVLIVLVNIDILKHWNLGRSNHQRIESSSSL